MPPTFAFSNPTDAIESLAERVAVVASESVLLSDAVGRVLATQVVADRPSPAADVSAMDGYAIRIRDLEIESPQIVAEMAPGRPAIEMPDAGVVRIFTGAIVPGGAEAVIKREETVEQADSITWHDDARQAKRGQNIRRQGENGSAGESVLEPGCHLTAASIATLANFGVASVGVHRRVRVAIVTTGDEVIAVDQVPEAFQLRNSNAASLAATVANCPFAELVSCVHSADEPTALKSALSDAIGNADAVWLSGGVSMGDYDYVPGVVKDCGGEVVFHGLPIRPGKPILGAVTPTGKVILGFPGNPVSATVNARRFGVPLLRRASAVIGWTDRPLLIDVKSDSSRTIPLHYFGLVRLIGPGMAEPVATKGSGDLVALGHSDGFVAVGPNEAEAGRWPFFAW